MDGSEAGLVEGARRRRRPRRLSDVFLRLSREADGPVSIANIRDALGNRSFAPLLVLFSALNMIPAPPGLSAILGLPLVILSAQMIYGAKQVWLPKFIMDRSLTAEQFRKLMDWIVPRLLRLERLIRPRYWPFWRRRGDRVIGVIAFIMAVVVTLPIPLGNWLPAFSTALLGLSLSERDGILFAIGSAVGLAALAVVVFVIGAASVAANALLGWIF